MDSSAPGSGAADGAGQVAHTQVRRFLSEGKNAVSLCRAFGRDVGLGACNWCVLASILALFGTLVPSIATQQRNQGVTYLRVSRTYVI